MECDLGKIAQVDFLKISKIMKVIYPQMITGCDFHYNYNR